MTSDADSAMPDVNGRENNVNETTEQKTQSTDQSTHQPQKQQPQQRQQQTTNLFNGEESVEQFKQRQYDEQAFNKTKNYKKPDGYFVHTLKPVYEMKLSETYLNRLLKEPNTPQKQQQTSFLTGIKKQRQRQPQPQLKNDKRQPCHPHKTLSQKQM